MHHELAKYLAVAAVALFFGGSVLLRKTRYGARAAILLGLLVLAIAAVVNLL